MPQIGAAAASGTGCGAAAVTPVSASRRHPPRLPRAAAAAVAIGDGDHLLPAGRVAAAVVDVSEDAAGLPTAGRAEVLPAHASPGARDSRMTRPSAVAYTTRCTSPLR